MAVVVSSSYRIPSCALLQLISYVLLLVDYETLKQKKQSFFFLQGKLTVSGCCFLLSSKSKIACLSVNIGVLVSIEFVVHSSISDTIFVIVLPAQWNANQQSLTSRIMNDYE